MAISPLWPKPSRWPIQQGLCHPGHRWVWHTRPRFILPLWEHASAGPRSAMSASRKRAGRQGPGSSTPAPRPCAPATAQVSASPRPTAPRSRPLPAAIQLRRLGAERALHDRSAAQGSIRWRIDQAPVPVGHFQHRRSHSVPFVRHHAKPASSGEWWRYCHHHVVRRDRERYHLVDDRRDLASGTPRAVRVGRSKSLALERGRVRLWIGFVLQSLASA
jgi:hypothetical protein